MQAGSFAGRRTFEEARAAVKFLPADPHRGHHKSPSILHSFKRRSTVPEKHALERAIAQVYQTAVHSALMPGVRREELWDEIAAGARTRIFKRRHQVCACVCAHYQARYIRHLCCRDLICEA